MSDNLSELLGRKGVHDNLFDHLGQLAKPKGAPSDEWFTAFVARHPHTEYGQNTSKQSSKSTLE